MSIEQTTEKGCLEGASQAQEKAALVVLHAPPGLPLRTTYEVGAELTIGREDGVELRIPLDGVSRRHARISRVGGKAVLRDLNSRNGTIVGGCYVRERLLSNLDELRIGDVILKYVQVDAARYLASVSDVDVVPRASHLSGLDGSVQMAAINAEIERIAPTGLACLLVGEVGTGKSTAAALIHRQSGRSGAFVARSAADVSAGDVRTAFADAAEGTLFLEEIEAMSMDSQAAAIRLLRAPDQHTMRVVCATAADLYGRVKRGEFRADFFARINEHVVRLPALRERKEDVLPLAKLFEASASHAAGFTFGADLALLHYDWPFNTRELQSAVWRAATLAGARPIDAAHLPTVIVDRMKTYAQASERVPAVESPPTAAETARAPTEDDFRAMVVRLRGNVSAIARELGKERMQVQRWVKRYGIDLSAYRDG